MSTIGILVDPAVYHHILDGQTGYEKLDLYHQAASRAGLVPIYLCLEDAGIENGYASGYKFEKGRYLYGRWRIPAVIHNRAMSLTKRRRRLLQSLKREAFVYNSNNRYNKSKIHGLLRSRFGHCLPRTVRYTPRKLQQMMRRHTGLFIKPDNGSVGKGIMKLSRQARDQWLLQKKGTPATLNQSDAENRVKDVVARRKYLIQTVIPLARYQGKPFDVRVSVQRGGNGRWRVNGMIGKVASQDSHVTNVARGGQLISCDTLFAKGVRHPAKARRKLTRLSLQLTSFLGRRLKHLADVGLDMGVSPSGKPYFIEMNGREQRYEFDRAGMPAIFYKTYENPIQYGKYLLRRRTRHAAATRKRRSSVAAKKKRG